jgi:hypothetical protein
MKGTKQETIEMLTADLQSMHAERERIRELLAMHNGTIQYLESKINELSTSDESKEKRTEKSK